MGDFTSQCATRHNLDSAHRDAFARRGWGGSRRQLMSSILSRPLSSCSEAEAEPGWRSQSEAEAGTQAEAAPAGRW